MRTILIKCGKATWGDRGAGSLFYDNHGKLNMGRKTVYYNPMGILQLSQQVSHETICEGHSCDYINTDKWPS